MRLNAYLARAGVASRRRADELLDDGRTAPARVNMLTHDDETALLELVLHEGRKHQVKRMCAAVGHPVRRLHRSRYAGLEVAALAPGRWRELSGGEVHALAALVG